MPVLEVSKSSQLTQWIGYEDKNKTNPVEYQIGKSKLPGTGFFRSFIYSDKAQPATIGVNHKNLEVYLNGILKFSQNSLWSGDQQINVELRSGLNVFEFVFLKGRRAARFMPAVYVYDPLGNPLPDAQYLTNLDQLRKADKEHQQEMAKAGNILRVQAAPELQFAPKRLQVQAGTKVTLIFSNPDVMLHNWLAREHQAVPRKLENLRIKWPPPRMAFKRATFPKVTKFWYLPSCYLPMNPKKSNFRHRISRVTIPTSAPSPGTGE